uniref:Zn(2)-C6 fungal-type domain-containing protein n=1 Tax=Ganoderma boninense TaxID=34458 RepID=A0A5K1JSU4_9APHY|nr:Zn(2)-C6 fungal-type domain-containing protein [Ganoderma boninense]
MVTPVPPEPTAPHGPKVDRKDRIQANMMHCQNCDNSRADGAKLFRCSACKTELYCSQKCQREAWPSHKSKCNMNRLADALRPDSVDVMKRLRAFSSKHGPSLADGGFAAMNIFEHPERATDSVFAVAMRPRRDSTRPETGFYVYDAGVFKIADLPYPPGELAKIREMIVTAGNTWKQRGAAGVFLVMMHNVEGCMSNMVPFTYYEEAENHLPKEMQENWKPYMLHMMNEGIVQ